MLDQREYLILGGAVRGHTAHLIGMPADLDDHHVDQARLPAARIVFLVEEDGGTLLLRYGIDGAFAGDTWHISRQEALEQIDMEFEGHDTDWRKVPEGATDLADFSRRLLSDHPAI